MSWSHRMRSRLHLSAGVSERDGEFHDVAIGCLDGLYSAALRLTRNRDAAEDLVQDTYLKALRAADRFEAGTNLRAWLFTILYNTFRNRVRDSVRDPVDVDSEAVDQATVPATTVDPEARMLSASLGEEVRAALDAIPEAYRQAVWLRDVEDFSYAEIAKMLGVPPGTVMSRISRGRRLLLRRLSMEKDPHRPMVRAGGSERA